MRTQVHDIGRRRAWAVWLVALSVYVLAIFHRSSLGVAGLLAAHRFGIDATQLAFFTVLQLGVYAGLQVPVGLALDKFGSRALLLTGLVLMTGGQFGFAFAHSFPAAVAARALIGAGDAMIFGSVIRLVTLWFLVRQAPLVTQLTGQIGQVGAIIAAGPLSYALHAFGWTRTFAAFSSVGLLLMVAVALGVKDTPYADDGPVDVKLRALAASLRLVWGNPSTRLGLWTHFTAQFAGTVFTLLWGYPFLVRGEGWSTAAASTLLMAMTGWVILSGLVLARLVTRFPFYRSVFVLVTIATMALAWAIVLLWPGRAPAALVVVMAFATASGGPASMVGFDLSRTLTPREAVGRANGVVNIGGFVASLLTMLLIGWVLDLRHSGGMAAYHLGDYKAALAVQFVFWTVGAVQIVRFRRRTIAHLRREHPGSVEAMRRGEMFVRPEPI